MTTAQQNTASTVIPNGKTVGAEIIGVDRSASLDDAAFTAACDANCKITPVATI
ncbi:MAG: hypothetical protein MJE12_26925 [Alphaproteobacteria bacterium]|nr:hypothetical protein [Alphaproteobacteria bacterium]